MLFRAKFSVVLATSALMLAACADKSVVRKTEPSPDGGPPIYTYEPRDTDDLDDCEIVDEGQIVLFQLSSEFPIYECPEDEDGGTLPPPLGETDAGTPPGETDAGTPPGDGVDAGTSSSDTDGGTPPQGEPDSGTPPQGEPDGGAPPGETDGGTPPQGETDAGTPPGETDAGAPPGGDTDASTPPGDTDGGTPPQGNPDSGTPPGDTDGGCEHEVDGGNPDEESPLCNRKITVVVHSGETTTYVDDVLHCAFTIENDAVNTRVVRSCDKETEMAETKVIGIVGKSGQLKVRLTTPHRCGHYHEL